MNIVSTLYTCHWDSITQHLDFPGELYVDGGESLLHTHQQPKPETIIPNPPPSNPNPNPKNFWRFYLTMALAWRLDYGRGAWRG
jgi:hypothetical protein